MTNPDHIARMLQLDPSETGSRFDAPRSARMTEDFTTPQGRAQDRDTAARVDSGLWATIRVLAVVLLVLIATLAALIAGPWLFGWIAERAAHDAAIAPQMMRF